MRSRLFAGPPLDSHGVPHINPWIVAIAVMFSTFMEVLDTTVVNVSLPHIAGSLSSTIDEATWVLTSYLVANAIILPITGWLANYFGRKRLLMMSVTGFTIASFCCGFAPTLSSLVIFRIIQGAAGGALQPLSQAVLLEAFPPEEHGKAMGFWGMGIVVAPILGPVLGGWLTDSYSWRWVFYINVPVGLLALFMTQMFVFDPPYIKRGKGGVDYWGIGMLGVGIGALQILLDKGQQQDWFASHWIAALATTSVVALGVFIYYELHTAAPVVDLRVFKLRTFSAGVFLMTVLGFVLYGSLVLLPIWMQTLLGYPALVAGMALAPRGVGSLIGMPLVGFLLPKADPRKFLAGGLLLGSITLFQFSYLSMDAGYWDFFWPQFNQGVALALLFVPLTTITMSPIAKPAMGNATSIFNLMRNVGGSIGIAGVTTLVDRKQQVYTNTLAGHVNPFNPKSTAMWNGLTQNFMAHGADAATAKRQGYVALWGMVQQQAAILSFLDVFWILGVVFLLMIPLVLVMKKPAGKSGPIAAH
ncbi:MAG: DHA2 family efflux MFS transporter permease subunit [Bryobacteraceae bacterium]